MKKNYSPAYNLSVLDREERDLINLANNLTKEEIWEKLEQKRFSQLKQAAVSLQSQLLFNNRCPKCTLLPPCKHYQTQDQILLELPHLMQQPQFKQNLSPKKRELLAKVFKEQQKLSMGNPNIGNYSQNTDSNSMEHQEFIQKFQQQLVPNDMEQHNLSAIKFNAEQESQNVADNIIHSNLSGNQVQPVIKNSGLRQEYMGNRTNRNINMSNTMVAPMGFRGISDHQQSGNNIHHSKLSHYGANIINGNQTTNIQARRHYLRKRQGNGGSPVPGLNDSKISEESITRGIPKQRDRTTVRIRTKNNQYLLGEASFTQPLSTTKNDIVKNHSYFETSNQSMQERERVQAMIAKYREEKIQRQIEKIEQEKMKIEIERQQQRDEEMRRKKYNDHLKQKLQFYQEIRQQEFANREREEREIVDRQYQKQRQRQQYYEQQRKYIIDYQEQKKRTDELLLIPVTNQPKNLYSNNFPYQSKQDKASKYQSSGGVYQPLGSGVIIPKAGAHYIKSGYGKIEGDKIKQNRKDYQNDQQNKQEEQELYEPYYDEQDDTQDLQQKQQVDHQQYRKKQKGKEQNKENDQDNNDTSSEGRVSSERRREVAKKDSLDLIGNA